jgi:transposase-like protein
MKCKLCGSERIVKNGLREKVQCYLCKDCRHQFTSEFGRHDDRDEKMAVSLRSAGLSFGTIAALFGVNGSTVYRWVKNFEASNGENPLPKGEILVEPNEMRNFVVIKKANYEYGKYITERLNRLLNEITNIKR